MSVNTAAAAYGAGRFGTAHKAPVEFSVIRQHRARGLGIQTIAKITGYSMEDVSRVLSVAEAS